MNDMDGIHGNQKENNTQTRNVKYRKLVEQIVANYFSLYILWVPITVNNGWVSRICLTENAASY